MTTPQTPDQQAWTTLHLASKTIASQIAQGQTPTLEHFLDLIRAVEDVDGVLFSDWWEREQATAAARKTLPVPRPAQEGQES